MNNDIKSLTLRGGAGNSASTLNTVQPGLSPNVEMAKAKLHSLSFTALLLVSSSSWASGLTADQRADQLISQMTFAQKTQFTALTPFDPCFTIIPGIPALGIPNVNTSDGSAGIVGSGGCPNISGLGGAGNTGFVATGTTQLPAALGLSASFDPQMALLYGDLTGKEARDYGITLNFGPGVNLAREPRGARTWEYKGEDPILAGIMTARQIQGIQQNGVITTVKHFALNDQDSNRDTLVFIPGGIRFGSGLDVNISERGMRESDLLAFEIAVKKGGALALLTAVNAINGVEGAGNSHLMQDIAKNEWGFKGFILDDIFSTATEYANAGLDVDFLTFLFGNVTGFGTVLLNPGIVGPVPPSLIPPERVDNMVHRVLRSMIAANLLDNPPVPKPIDINRGNAVAQTIAEQGAVLLQNNNNLLPLKPNQLSKIAVIGSHADQSVIMGLGSSTVIPSVGSIYYIDPNNPTDGRNCQFGIIRGGCTMWTLSSPKNAIQALAPSVTVAYDSGLMPSQAAALAANSDVAIVFVHSISEAEGVDRLNLSLASGFGGRTCSNYPFTSDCVDQDALISQVAAANPKTIVVLETVGPVLMPWKNSVGSILEVWTPGVKGGEAIANLLFGKVNPSGKLPITFPLSENDLPRPVLAPNQPFGPNPAIQVDYNIEAQNVGYKWFDSQNKPVLFPFGHGLSYTTFAYSKMQVVPEVSDGNKVLRVNFTLKNTGKVAGAEVAQIYVKLPSSVPNAAPKRLVAFKKVFLQPGESRNLTVKINPNSVKHPISYWNVNKGPTGGFGAWDIVDGTYTFYLGTSSRDIKLTDTVVIRDMHDDDNQQDQDNDD